MKFWCSVVFVAVWSCVSSAGAQGVIRANQKTTARQRVTIVARNGTRQESTREIKFARKPAQGSSSRKAHPLHGAPALLKALPTLQGSRTGTGKVHPSLLPGYPNATINSQYFGSTAVGQTSDTITLTYPYPSGVTEQNLTFASGLNGFFGQATCNYPQPCTAPLAFQPSYPGLTTNAVISKDQNGSVIYETLLYAMGTAPQLGFDLGDLTIQMGVTNQPGHVAVGPDGSIYLTDPSQNAVYQIASDFSSQTQLSIAGLGTPGGIAVDGAGTLYIADKTNNVVIAYNAQYAGQTTVSTSQLSNPNGVAVDGSGDLFIADTGNDRILMILPNGTEQTYASDIAAPTSIATDRSGNVYYADASNGGEVTQLADGSSTIGTQLGTLYDIAVDAAGTVYISTSTGLTLIGTGDYGIGETTTFGGGPNYGMALDPAGDVITTQPANGSVSVTNRTASNFILTTPVGTTTSGGDIISNTGTDPLTLTNIAISGTVFTDDGSDGCFSNLTIQPGFTCQTVVDFSPTAAQQYLESYEVTSNSLNMDDSATNIDALYGNGTALPTTTALSIAPSPATVGQTVVLTATVTRTADSEEPLPTGTVNFFDGMTMLGSGDLSSGGIAQFSTSSLAAGTHSITASYAGDNYNAVSTSAAQNLVVTAGSTTNTLGISPASLSFGNQTVGTTSAPQTVTVTNNGTTAVTIASDSDSDPTNFGFTQTCGGPLAAGASCTLTVTFHPAAAGALTESITLNDDAAGSPQTVVVTGTGVAGTTTTLSVTSGGSAVTTVASGSVVTLTAAVVVGTAPVSGQVAFCDATATTCTDSHLLGTAQVTSAGTATYKFVPGIGSHSYKAVFLGTASDAGSASGASALAVTGTYPTTTTIAESGTAGNYTLTGTVTGLGSPTLSPTGTVSFNDTTASPATVLGTAALGGGTLALTEAQATGSPLSAGTEPSEVASGDFNGDGFADLAVVNNQDQTVGVFLGNGDGTFRAQVTYAINGNDPVTVQVADFNGDGHLDLAVVNFDDGTVSVLLGNGDGTFQAEQTYSVGQSSAGLAVMDLNHDGIPDIVVAEGAYQAGYGAAGVLLGKGDGTFNALVSYTAGANAVAVAEGDFNGDGNVDIVTASYDTATVSILLGNGDGTFQMQVTYPVGSHPLAVQVGDFNGDGIPDLAVSNYVDQTVSVLLGKGDGTFQPQVTYAIGSGPDGLVVADVNGDGNLDIAVANNAGNTIGILLGKGDGTFQTQVTYPTGAGPGGLTVGDFNGDGYPDLAIANLGDNTATILLSEVTQTATATATGVSPTGAGTHNVDASYPGDTNFGSSVSATTGLTGTTGAPITPTITWAAPASILYGTALSGTQLDAVATGTGGVGVNGTFVYTPAAGTVLGVGEHLLSVTFTPTDAGYGPATGSTTISVTQFTPYLTWATPAPITTTTPLSATQLDAVANDINGVAVPGTYDYTPEAGSLLAAGTQQITVTFTPTDTVDYLYPVSTTRSIVVTQAAGPTATVTTLNLAASTAAYQKPIPLFFSVATSGGFGVSTGQVAFCDAAATVCNALTNLGVAQLTILDGTASDVFVLPGGTIGQHQYVAKFLGTSSYMASTSTPQTVTITGKYPTSTTIAATGTGGTYSLTGTVAGLGTNALSPTGTVSFLDTSNANASLGTATLGAGTLGFAETPSATSPYTVGGGPYGQATGDFNGDGLLDLVVQNYNGGTVSVLLGNGDGTFQPQVTYAVGTLPERVLVADLNGDGKLDLIVANTGSQSIGVLLGNGDGTFQAQVTYPCGSPVGLGVMDINHDGYPDVVAGDYYNNTISVLLGNGDGTLQAAVTYATGGTPQTLAEGDFNGDGNVDVAVGNFGGGTVGIFLGNGDGTFQAMVTYPVGNQPQGVQVGDFNGDGKQDLAVSNSADGTVGVLLGNGDGTFQTQVTYAVGNVPVGLVIADFNGDGFQDISVGNTGSNAQSVLLGNGDGTFQTQLAFTTGRDPYGATIGDFNGDGYPDISVSNFVDGTITILLSQVTETATATANVTVGGSGTSHTVEASYPGDTNFSPSVSQPTTLTGGGATTAASMTTLVITPAAATVGQSVMFSASVFGTTQTTPVATGTVILMNAGAAGPAVLGTITLGTTGSGAYSTTTLAAGTYVVTAVYSGDTSYAASSSAPVTLTVSAAASLAPTLTSISPAGGVTGSPATIVTLTGTNFAATDVVHFGEGTLVTTYVNATTLTALVPATLFGSPAAYPVTVTDTANQLTSGTVNFVVSTAPDVVFTGPSTAISDQQPVVTFQLVQPYAVPINCLLTLTFAPSTPAGIVDPAVQFSSGGTTINVTIPAGSTATPPVAFQTGTVAGTVTVTLTITDATGDPLTPPNVAPVVVTLPATVPQITSTAANRATDIFTVTVQGYSNTREVKTAIFHFTPMPGATLSDPDVTVDVTGVFAQWFSSEASDQYGSSFTYTQPFNLNADPATIQSVTVTLVNSIGSSVVETAQ